MKRQSTFPETRSRGGHTAAENQAKRPFPTSTDAALLVASSAGDVTKVDALLKINANVNANESGMSSLHYASLDGHEMVVRRLLRGKASVNQKTRCKRNTPLLLAVRSGAHKVVDLLLEAKADMGAVDALERFSLWYAISYGFHKVSFSYDCVTISQLLEAKADLEQTDRAGRTPLMLACCNGHSVAVSALLLAKANVNAKTSSGKSFFTGWTALHHACDSGHLECIELLLRAGGDYRAKAPHCASPLQMALKARHPLLVLRLASVRARLASLLDVSEIGSARSYIELIRVDMRCVREAVVRSTILHSDVSAVVAEYSSQPGCYLLHNAAARNLKHCCRSCLNCPVEATFGHCRRCTLISLQLRRKAPLSS